MINDIQLDMVSLTELYGPSVYNIGNPSDSLGLKPVAIAQVSALPTEEATREPQVEQIKGTTEITWKLKPGSVVLFILNAQEFSDPELGALLKKIVASIKIPFELAGFGVINGPLAEDAFARIPKPFGVVFDRSLMSGDANPAELGGNEVFFSHSLSELSQNNAYKKELWEYLQKLQPKIS